MNSRLPALTLPKCGMNGPITEARRYRIDATGGKQGGMSIARRYSGRRHRTSRLAPYAMADSVVIQKLVGQSV
jgi:hypothetical protein